MCLREKKLFKSLNISLSPKNLIKELQSIKKAKYTEFIGRILMFTFSLPSWDTRQHPPAGSWIIYSQGAHSHHYINEHSPNFLTPHEPSKYRYKSISEQTSSGVMKSPARKNFLNTRFCETAVSGFPSVFGRKVNQTQKIHIQTFWLL